MANLFPIILSCVVFSVISGMYLGFLLAIYIYTKQNKMGSRMKNIQSIAQDLFDGLYEGREKDVALFILCESDLNIRKADLNTECYERMVENSAKKES